MIKPFCLKEHTYYCLDDRAYDHIYFYINKIDIMIPFNVLRYKPYSDTIDYVSWNFKDKTFVSEVIDKNILNKIKPIFELNIFK